MKPKVFFAIFLIVCLAVGIFGVYQLYAIKECSPVIASVVGEEFDTQIDAEGREITYRFPVYEYSFNGETVRNRSTMSGDAEIGKQVTIYLSEDGKMFEVRSGKMLTLAGFGAAAACVFALAYLKKREQC